MPRLRKNYKTFEEKETDVNIAVTMLLEAANDTFDKAILFCGDSDLIAGVEALKKFAPHKQIQVVVPFGRSSIDLVNTCHSSAKIKRKHLENNQLPTEILLPDGKKLIKPLEWT
jgi:uncharacterized LabA/DUF88 family protein